MKSKKQIDENIKFKVAVVEHILRGEVDKALEILSEKYGVEKPTIKVGRIKGKSKVPALYDPLRRTIYIQNPEKYNDPIVILHEYYHHLRYIDGKHRGTEKYANKYAIEFIKTYRDNILNINEENNK